jgi:hypothetical protein
MKRRTSIRMVAATVAVLAASPFVRHHNAHAQEPHPVYVQQPTVQEFFIRVFERNRGHIERKFSQNYAHAVVQGLDDTPSNKRIFTVAMFLHELVKNDGILGFTWVIANEDPNTPVSLLQKAFASTPTGTIYARCDRLEMTYKALLRLFGIPSQIILYKPNHTSTEVKIGDRFLVVDNALDVVDITTAPTRDRPPADGRYSIRRTNRRAVLDDTVLDASGIKRVDDTISRWLTNSRSDN